MSPANYHREYYARNRAHIRSSRRRHQAAQRLRNRRHVWAYKASKGCIDCGERDPIVLDLDHRDPSTKVAAVARLSTSCVSLIRLDKEMQKCDVRCANCHRRRTHASRSI